MAEANGVDLTLSFDTPAQRDHFVDSLRLRGIECGRLESLWSGHSRQGGQEEGLIMSFAHLSDADFEHVRRLLAW